MLTNEQRAHDLAISMLPTAMLTTPSEDEMDEDGNVTRDAVSVYLKLYEKALNKLNEVFV